MKNKMLMALLSLAISFGLWLYVVTVVSPESETTIENVSIELVGTNTLSARNLIVVSDTSDLKMDLTLTGNRSDLRLLNSSNVTVLADLSGISTPGEHRIDCNVSFRSGTAEVKAQNPEYITVVVAEQETKTVDIKTFTSGTVAQGYEVDREHITVDHTVVTVKGPKDVVEQVASAHIYIDLDGKRTSFMQSCDIILYDDNDIPIVNERYITLNVDQINVSVQVYKVKEIQLKYDVRYDGSGFSSEMVNVYPSVTKVTVIGNEEDLLRIENEHTFVIDLSQYSETVTQKLTLPLPESLRCRESIDVEIQIIAEPAYKKLTLTAEQLHLTGLADNLEVRLPETLTVEVWGAQEDLDKLEETALTVDCSALTAAGGLENAVCRVEGKDYMKVNVDWSGASVAAREAQG